MARHYVPQSGRAIPDSPEALGEFLASQHAMQDLYGYGPGSEHKQAAFHRAYMRAFTERDGGEVAAQVREQLGPLARARPGGAVAALWSKAAPGAAAYEGQQWTAGEFFTAAWHGSKGTPGQERLSRATAEAGPVRNSYGSEVPGDGGFLIPEDVRSELVFASLSLGAVRQRARVFPATTLRTALPVLDDATHSGSVFGVTAYWAEEGASLTESTAAFALAVLDAKGLKGLFNTPNELIADAPAWEVFIGAAVPEAWAYYEDLAYLTGTGTGEPMGMVGCDGAVQVAKQTGQASATIVWENIVGMAARLLPTSWPRAIWAVASDAFTDLATMALAVGTSGGPVFLADTGTMSIFGRPVYFYDFLPKLGSVGDVNLIDPAYYAIADRMTLQVASSPHLKFGQDITVWRPVSRQDARPLLSSALTPRNGASNTLSAYIQLAAR